MKIKGKFVAMLIGENSELRTRKTDGQPYAYNTVAIMQDGMVDNLRVEDGFFKELKNYEHFKQYEFQHTYDTQYSNFVVVAAKPFGGFK